MTKQPGSFRNNYHFEILKSNSKEIQGHFTHGDTGGLIAGTGPIKISSDRALIGIKRLRKGFKKVWGLTPP